MEEENIVTQTREREALVIRVQSWATPVVGLLMLVVGFLGGYLSRPLLASQITPATPTAASTQGSAATSSSAVELMQNVVAQTRHFKGEEGAPVTVIEFSDFQ